MTNNIAQRNNHPNWIIFDDMNIITFNNENVGGNPPDLNLTHTINNTFNDCHLFDIDY